MNVNPNHYPAARGNLQRKASGSAGRPVERRYDSGGMSPKCDEEILFTEQGSHNAELFLNKSSKFNHRHADGRKFIPFGRTKVEYECPACSKVHFTYEGSKNHGLFVNQSEKFVYRRSGMQKRKLLQKLPRHEVDCYPFMD